MGTRVRARSKVATIGVGVLFVSNGALFASWYPLLTERLEGWSLRRASFEARTSHLRDHRAPVSKGSFLAPQPPAVLVTVGQGSEWRELFVRSLRCDEPCEEPFETLVPRSSGTTSKGVD
ncbi:MAG: hypothetical protein R2722_15165 [Tessaracoccus sp.]